MTTVDSRGLVQALLVLIAFQVRSELFLVEFDQLVLQTVPLNRHHARVFLAFYMVLC